MENGFCTGAASRDAVLRPRESGIIDVSSTFPISIASSIFFVIIRFGLFSCVEAIG